jgi:hypothetical protein
MQVVGIQPALQGFPVWSALRFSDVLTAAAMIVIAEIGIGKHMLGTEHRWGKADMCQAFAYLDDVLGLFHLLHAGTSASLYSTPCA